jgi:hypothetical protein
MAKDNGCYISNNGYDGFLEVIHEGPGHQQSCFLCEELARELTEPDNSVYGEVFSNGYGDAYN